MGGREGGGGGRKGGQLSQQHDLDMNGDEVFQCQFDLYLVGETSFHRNSENEIKYYAPVGGGGGGGGDTNRM